MNTGRSLRERTIGSVIELPPSVFSMVMATGIVSISSDLFGLGWVARALLVLNIAAYAIIAGLYLLKLATAPGRIWADFRPHASAPGFFTIVAGTCVLGTQLTDLAHKPMAALILWCLGLLLWLVLIYAFFTVMTISPDKPRLEEGMNGTWMLIVVSTQSVSALGTSLAGDLGAAKHFVLGFGLVLFLLGCMFYILILSLTLYRFLFYPFDPIHLTPPYWINMGSVANTTLAGSSLMLRASEWVFLQEVLPFLKGFTLLFWSTATWWIPLLLALEAWRHIGRKVPIHYDLQYWSVVFPIGMYSVATFRLVDAIDWGQLAILAHAVGYCGLFAWALTAFGLVRRAVYPR